MNATKITASLRENEREDFSKTDLWRIGTLDVAIVLGELSYASEISVSSQKAVTVYLEV